MPAILCATFLLSVSGLRFWLPLRLRALIFSRRTLGAASWLSQPANQHGEANAVADVDGGQMDGFIAQRDQARRPVPIRTT